MDQMNIFDIMIFVLLIDFVQLIGRKTKVLIQYIVLMNFVITLLIFNYFL